MEQGAKCRGRPGSQEHRVGSRNCRDHQPGRKPPELVPEHSMANTRHPLRVSVPTNSNLPYQAFTQKGFLGVYPASKSHQQAQK